MAYDEAIVPIARAMSRMGATDWDLAEEFGVSRQTIWKWQIKHEAFADAIKVGRDSFDDRVEHALAHRAVGYTFKEEKLFHYQGSIVRAQVDTHIAPDVSAAKLWLTNRRRKTWSDAKQLQHTGKDGEALPQNTSTIEQARLVAFAMHRAIEAQRDVEDIDAT